MFVKPEHGNGSFGINEQSVVHNVDELKVRVKEIIKEFGGALVKQYIDGRKFSVLVVGSNYAEIQTSQPVELKFSATGPAFPTYEEKWHGNYQNWCLTDEKETSLIEELTNMSTKLYKAFNGEGSARFDIRQDARTKKLYMLDVNSNPSCSVDTVFHLTDRSKLKCLKLLIDHAFERQKRFHSTHRFLIKYSESKSFGLYARARRVLPGPGPGPARVWAGSGSKNLKFFRVRVGSGSGKFLLIGSIVKKLFCL